VEWQADPRGARVGQMQFCARCDGYRRPNWDNPLHNSGHISAHHPAYALWWNEPWTSTLNLAQPDRLRKGSGPKISLD